MDLLKGQTSSGKKNMENLPWKFPCKLRVSPWIQRSPRRKKRFVLPDLNIEQRLMFLAQGDETCPPCVAASGVL